MIFSQDWAASLMWMGFFSRFSLVHGQADGARSSAWGRCEDCVNVRVDTCALLALDDVTEKWQRAVSAADDPIAEGSSDRVARECFFCSGPRLRTVATAFKNVHPCRFPHSLFVLLEVC